MGTKGGEGGGLASLRACVEMVYDCVFDCVFDVDDRDGENMRKRFRVSLSLWCVFPTWYEYSYFFTRTEKSYDDDFIFPPFVRVRV